MAEDLTAYRASEREQNRIHDLFSLIPESGVRALDIGARDGFLSKRLAERFDSVVALDLERPDIVHSRIEPVQGDATRLEFDDASFDLVLCAEVLEHIPPAQLAAACKEISRVTRNAVVIGVPYRQDLRCGETTCYACGGINPPWGHVNSFDEARLRDLFSTLEWKRCSYVGNTVARTNVLSTALLRFAGNPFGTYMQNEPCVHCGAALAPPPQRNLPQKLATRTAHILNVIQAKLIKPQPNWIHVLFSRQSIPTS